jgi:DNA invertase Pin-like site-specific DNA recombinase
MTKVGYARVSSTGQSLELQLDKLTKAGCTKIYKEKLSGTTTQRPEFKNCMEYLREGDCLVITRLDRLARSVLHLADILSRFEKEGINLHVLDQNIDTSTSSGKLLFNMLASVAEFENALRRERQQEGIERAKANKVRFGRRPKLTPEMINNIAADRDAGLSVGDLKNRYRLSIATIYRALASQKSQFPVDNQLESTII